MFGRPKFVSLAGMYAFHMIVYFWKNRANIAKKKSPNYPKHCIVPRLLSLVIGRTCRKNSQSAIQTVARLLPMCPTVTLNTCSKLSKLQEAVSRCGRLKQLKNGQLLFKSGELWLTRIARRSQRYSESENSEENKEPFLAYNTRRRKAFFWEPRRSFLRIFFLWVERISRPFALVRVSPVAFSW